MKTVLVVANETIGGRPLIEAIRKHAAEGDARFVLCVPQTRPRPGYVIYDDAVFDAAQARVDLALGSCARRGSTPSARSATPILRRDDGRPPRVRPDEIIISTYPETRSGWSGATSSIGSARRPGSRSSMWWPTPTARACPSTSRSRSPTAPPAATSCSRR